MNFPEQDQLASWEKKYVDPRISKNDASAAGIFYGEFGLAILTGNTTLKTLSQPYRYPQSH
jgi:hypothetical protein